MVNSVLVMTTTCEWELDSALLAEGEKVGTGTSEESRPADERAAALLATIVAAEETEDEMSEL